MKPAVLRPNIASRFLCSIGSRTSACTPLMKARPDSRAYLSSRVTLSSALRTASGRGAFIVVDSPGEEGFEGVSPARDRVAHSAECRDLVGPAPRRDGTPIAECRCAHSASLPTASNARRNQEIRMRQTFKYLAISAAVALACGGAIAQSGTGG